MDSNDKQKQQPAKPKEPASRRTFLRYGTLGAAVLAAGVLGSQVNAAVDQPGVRSIAKVRTQKQMHQAAPGRVTRSAGTVRSAGAPKEIATQAMGTRSLQPKTLARSATVKATKAPEGARSQMGSRMTARSGTAKAMKAAKTMKAPG
jgi:hypothetical protein